MAKGRKPLDLTGQRFGRLVALENTGEKDRHGNYFWRCICDCGNEVERTGQQFRGAAKPNCGCLYDRQSRKAEGPPPKILQGIAWDQGENRWLAYLLANGERLLYRYYKTQEEASKARKAAIKKHNKGKGAGCHG